MIYNLEKRLVQFAVGILDLSEQMPDNKGAAHLTGQLIRSGTAPALQYGEALSAESRKDFIHKLRIGLKELRETSICLQIILVKSYVKNPDMIRDMYKENCELIAIFTKSIQTAKDNLRKKPDLPQEHLL